MAQSIYKYDTSTNWAKAKKFYTEKDELIYYSNLNKFKKEDGINLPFSINTYKGKYKYLEQE